ncbi:MAG: class I SAM-dependent methyltransferase [Nocardioidaceae bacterium]
MTSARPPAAHGAATSAPRAWDADSYERVSGVQVAWARAVLDRLELRGDETVLDAGCGSGRVTRMLLERLPRGRVIAVDADAEMVRHARGALGESATVLRADLVELELETRVDAVFSNAVFHWVLDHDRLFERLRAALVTGGRMGAQCGGEGNIERFLSLVDGVTALSPFADHLAGFRRTWLFAGPAETEERLRRAGFAAARAWLEPSDVTPDDPREFLRTVVLAVHLSRLPDELADPFLDAVLERCPAPLRLDYVRLNIEARA